MSQTVINLITHQVSLGNDTTETLTASPPYADPPPPTLPPLPPLLPPRCRRQPAVPAPRPPGLPPSLVRHRPPSPACRRLPSSLSPAKRRTPTRTTPTLLTRRKERRGEKEHEGDERREVKDH